MKLILAILLWLTVSLQAQITNGLVGWWKMDEGTGTTVADSSGNGNTGYLTNGVAWSSGRAGNCLAFALTNGVLLEKSNSIMPTTNFSVCGWIRSDSLSASAGWMYSTYDGMVGENGYALGFVSTNLSIYFSYEKKLSFAMATNSLWRHIAMVSDNANYRLFLDGTQKTNSAASYTPTMTGVFPLIGQLQNAGSFIQGFNGQIDDVRIYSRALSTNEIASIYTGAEYHVYRTAHITTARARQLVTGTGTNSGRTLTATTATVKDVVQPSP